MTERTDLPAARSRRAQDFLELVERSRRGRLKVYLGFAAGVGKTFRMLEEAQALKKRGVDVVLGYIETHGRADTAALIDKDDGLEAVPRRTFAYRGVDVEEMDVDAVLARRPQVAIVDEVAHTNVPGSRNNKRYQDINDILEAGINVICAFNIQHLESLNDLVERVTGVVVRETVPDTFLKQADQVVTLDLDVQDLLERLRSGKIYTEDKIAWALAHFFKDQNLSTLRELALREVAESLDRSVTAQRAMGEGEAKQQRSGRKVMACLSSNPPHARMLLRRASRMAGRLNTDWYVVYIETPQEAPDVIDSEAQRHLLGNIEAARELGAEVVRLRAPQPVPALLDFARTHSVSDIVIGRSPQPFWRQIIQGSFTMQMVRQAAGFDVHIVSFEEKEERE